MQIDLNKYKEFVKAVTSDESNFTSSMSENLVKIERNNKDVKMALLMTGAQRLRPVLLTTTTTVLGLMPMALKINIDFVNLEYTYNSPDTQWWVDLSRAIIFGLLFSTLLTLLVTPSALMIKSKFLSGGSAEKSKKVKKQVKYS